MRPGKHSPALEKSQLSRTRAPMIVRRGCIAETWLPDKATNLTFTEDCIKKRREKERQGEGKSTCMFENLNCPPA